MLQMVKLGRILDHFGSKAVQMCQMINSSPIFCKWTLSFLLLRLLTGFRSSLPFKNRQSFGKAFSPRPAGLRFTPLDNTSIRNSLGIIPTAPWPLGPGGAEGAVRARSARPPVRARSARPSARARAKRAPPAPQGPTQGVSISTALAKAALRINCAASKLRCEKVALKPIKGRR